MSSQASTAVPAGDALGDEGIVYSPLSRSGAEGGSGPSATQDKSPEQQQPTTAEAAELAELRKTVESLWRDNIALRVRMRAQDADARQAVAGLQAALAHAHQQVQGAQMTVAVMHNNGFTANATRAAHEEYLAGIVKSARLQIPCKEGQWQESMALLSLPQEVEMLRTFVEYQYQSEMLWGSDEIHSPRFWYEQGGFYGRRTGPDGDGGVWLREKEKK